MTQVPVVVGPDEAQIVKRQDDLGLAQDAARLAVCFEDTDASFERKHSGASASCAPGRLATESSELLAVGGEGRWFGAVPSASH